MKDQTATFVRIEPARFCRAQRAYRRQLCVRAMIEQLASWTFVAPAIVGLIAIAFAGRLAVAFAPVPVWQPIQSRAQRLAARPAVRYHAAATTVRLRDGQDIGDLLIEAGVTHIDAIRAATLVDAALFPDRVVAGTEVSFTTGAPDRRDGRLLEQVTLRPQLDREVTVLRKPAGLALLTRPIAIDASPLELRGTVGHDLAGSLTAAHTPAGQVRTIAAALRDHLDKTTALLPSDRFELVFEQARARDGRVMTGSLLYAALRRDERPLTELIRWKDHDGLSDVSSERAALDGAREALPIRGRLTSRYGIRFHPILGYTRLHAGIDIGAPWGARVVAARRGTVLIAGWQGGHGNYVRLDHGSGLNTGYAHLSRLAVSPGEHVLAGQLIGYVGSTGLSTGPHLHYEVFRAGRPVDPLRDGLAASAGSAPDSRAFVAAVASLRSLITAP